jgi:hypothetical protein
MQIAAAQLSYASSHEAVSALHIEESLRVQSAAPPPLPPVQDVVQLSDQSREAASVGLEPDEGLPATQDEVKLAIVKQLLERLTGKAFDSKTLQSFLKDLRRGHSAEAPGHQLEPPGRRVGQQSGVPQGAGFVYDYRSTYVEQESLAFAASGVIQTKDGREISFSVSLTMSRTFIEEHSIHVEAGDTRALKDPLVVNLEGSTAQLTSTRFAFDLDADGAQEEVPLVGGGAGLLGLDSNGNGRIDSGAELFGPTTGDGFAELGALDADANGWVDGADPGYGRLVVWFPGGEGRLASASSLGIGAISTASQPTPFSITDQANQLLGQVRASGVYLNEGGSVGTIQQVDVVG